MVTTQPLQYFGQHCSLLVSELSKFELERVQEFAARIPEVLQPYLGEDIPVFGESGWLDAVEAKGLLLKMQKLAEKTEDFWTSATRTTATRASKSFEAREVRTGIRCMQEDSEDLEAEIQDCHQELEVLLPRGVSCWPWLDDFAIYVFRVLAISV